MIICVEGYDCSGKDTVAAALAIVLDAEVINFPNDDAYTGPLIRSYLRKEWAVEGPNGYLLEKNGGPLAFQALQIANRMESMPKLRAHENNEKGHLILVRYWQSGYVYGGVDGLDDEWLLKVHADMVQPDINILLDIDPKTALKRRAARDGDVVAERYEVSAFAKKVVSRYRQLWDQNYDDDDWIVVNAHQSILNVVTDCLRPIFRELWDEIQNTLIKEEELRK